jgi:hypothetical protein
MWYFRYGAHFREGAVAEEKGKLFPSSGKKCDIIFPVKWKIVSTCTGNLIPDAGQFMGNPLGLSRSNFGIPIAMQCVAD